MSEGVRSPLKAANAANKKTQFQETHKKRQSQPKDGQENFMDKSTRKQSFATVASQAMARAKSFSRQGSMGSNAGGYLGHFPPMKENNAQGFRQQAKRRSSIFGVDLDEIKYNRMNSLTDASMISFGSRNSTVGLDLSRPRQNLENTYRIEPIGLPDISEINQIMVDVLATTLESVEYDYPIVHNLIKAINTEIHRRVKRILRDQARRHAMIIQVYCVENAGQDFSISSKWLWSEKYDNHTTAKYETSSLSAVAICHVIYTE